MHWPSFWCGVGAAVVGSCVLGLALCRCWPAKADDGIKDLARQDAPKKLVWLYPK